MSLGVSRAILRRQAVLFNRQALIRRSASTTAEAANTAKQTASDAASTAKEKLGTAQSKASEGLTRVTSSAGNALGAVGRAVGSIGGRTGRLIGAVQGLIPPTLYYSRVGLELGKVVVEARSMNPPSAQTFQNYFNRVVQYVRNPSAIQDAASSATKQAQNTSPQNVLSQVRNADRQQITTAAIIGAEVLGFFTVGEMLGRLKIVGYRSSAPAAHHD